MKEIKAVIQPFMLDNVLDALREYRARMRKATATIGATQILSRCRFKKAQSSRKADSLSINPPSLIP